jgi:hypothetical protein
MKLKIFSFEADGTTEKGFNFVVVMNLIFPGKIFKKSFVESVKGKVPMYL